MHLRVVAVAFSRTGSARRGGRYPEGAPTVAVGLAGRLRCDARSAVARRNSLHSLRSLRSNNRRKSEDEARAARAPTAPLALQAALDPRARLLARHGQSTGLAVSGLAFSPPHKSPPPGTAHRADTLGVFVDACNWGAGKAGGGCAPAATYAAPRSTGLVAARASALRDLTRRDCPSATNAVSGASFATGHETEYRKGTLRAAKGCRIRAPAHTHPRLCHIPWGAAKLR
jgi:hypothetical protein